MIVKEDQSQLRAEYGAVFTLPPIGDRQATAQTVDLGHGRVEQRNITTSEALVGYSDWPGLAQVFELGRHVMFQRPGKERVEVVYGVTTWPRAGNPQRLLALVRGRWQIVNKWHSVRDVTFDEDRSQVRYGNTPQVMAALRDTCDWSCSGTQAIRTLRRQCRRLAVSRYKRWLSSGLNWKTR